MIKKLFYFTLFTLFYLLTTNTSVNALESCSLFVNDEHLETIELPFYLHEIASQFSNKVYAAPIVETTTITTHVDSLTKCELINKKIYYVDLNSFLGGKTRHSIEYSFLSTPSEDSTNANIIEATEENPTTTVKGYASFIDLEPPTFEGYKEKYTTNIDNPISLKLLLSNISAYDKRDGNLTSKIKVEYNEYEENLDKLGIYVVILSVEDAASNKTSISFQIELVDKTPPTIEGKQEYISYFSSPLTLEEIKSNLEVIDNYDPSLNNELYLCDDNYSLNKNKVGVYNSYFCIMDHSGNNATPYRITIEVKDDVPPTIEGLDYYTSKLSSPLTIQEIMYSLASIDNHNDVSSSIFVKEDYYTNYKNSLGEKSIFFQAMDEYHNVSLPFKVTVNLIDDVPPQIFGLNTYTSYLSNPLSISYLKQQLTVLDNFDNDISANLEIVEDSYTNNINRKGTYYLTFICKDSSSNISSNFKVTITNIDDIPPTIKGNTTLTYKYDNKPSLNDIVSLYTLEDNVDVDLKLQVIDETYTTSETLGTYYLTLTGTDASNNSSVPFLITINITDTLLTLHNISIYLPTSSFLSIEEINSLINLDETYTVLENTYEPNYSIEGTYKIIYKLNEVSNIEVSITTFTPAVTLLTTEEKKETFLTKIKSFFKNIFNYIKNFFSSFLLILKITI